MELHQLVYNLLFKEQCVIVPEFGGFITRDSPAGINAFTKDIKPKTKSVFFNAHMLYDDGLLINHLSGLEQISFEEAKNKIAQKVEEIKSILEKNNKISFGEIGEIIKNQEGNTILIVNKNLNLDLNSFGLEPITLKPLERKVEEVPVVEIEESPEEIVVPTQETEPSRRSYKWIPIAASIILLAVFGYFALTNNWFAPNKQVVANVDSVKEDVAGIISGEEQEGIEQEGIEEEGIEEVEMEEENGTYDEITTDEVGESDYVEEEEKAALDESIEETVQKEELISAEVDNIQPEDAKYLVVLGSFLNVENATRYSKILARKGVETSLYEKENSSLSRLVYKGFQSKEEAEQERETLSQSLQVNAIVFVN